MEPGRNRISLFMAFLMFHMVVQTHALLDPLGENNLQTEVAKLRSELDFYKKQIDALNNTLTAHLGGNHVAFTAFLGQTITNLAPHQTIVFNSVLTNVGNAYDNADGHFQAPVPGTYIFFVTLTNTPGHSTSADLVKNGRTMSSILAHSRQTTEFETVTTATTVVMAAGERIWVQNEHSFSAVETVDGGQWSSFSGHLIH